jgi:hypothetical protein
MSQTKPSRLPFVLLPLAPTLLGFVIGILLADYPMLYEKIALLSAWDILLVPLFFFLTIVLHELGHLLGGISAGMRFLLLIVGPLHLTRGERGLQLRWLFNPATLVGIAAATPDTARPLAPQLRRFIIGGLLSSLLFGGLGIWLSFLFGGRWGAWAFLVGGFSLILFLVNSVPFRSGGFMSDGMQLLGMLRGGKAVEERQRVTTILSQSYAGARPRHWNKEIITQLLTQECEEPMWRVAARLYAFFQALDEGALEEATHHSTWLGDNFALFPQGFRQSITLELALFAVLYQNDLEVGRQWWAQSHGGVVDEARRSLTEALLALLSEDKERAACSLQKARQRVSQGMDPGLNLFTRDQLELVAQRLAA